MFSFFKRKNRADLPPLKFHNTLSGVTENFVPLGKVVKMYNCGPTVYDRQHIGNLRGAVLSNVVRRALEMWEYKIQHVSNLTDVGHLTGDNLGDPDTGEDRMEASVRKTGRSAQEIAEEITRWYFEDLDALGIDRKKIEFSRATDYIPDQIALVETLWEKGYAYKISDGIYFDTAKFPTLTFKSSNPHQLPRSILRLTSR